MYVCACVCACMRACVHACVHVCVCERWRERQILASAASVSLIYVPLGSDKAPRWPLQEAPCRNSHRSHRGTLSSPWGADVKPWSMHVVTTQVVRRLFIFKNTPCPRKQPSMTMKSLLTPFGRWTFEWNCSYSNFNRYAKILTLEMNTVPGTSVTLVVEFMDLVFTRMAGWELPKATRVFVVVLVLHILSAD